jgi:hypothetical protein
VQSFNPAPAFVQLKNYLVETTTEVTKVVVAIDKAYLDIEATFADAPLTSRPGSVST